GTGNPHWKYPTTSRIRCTVPPPARVGRAFRPVAERGRTALLARTWPVLKFIVLVLGITVPAGQATRCPPAVAPTTVRFAGTALASAGMPQVPATAKVRVTPEASGVVARVSKTRQGVT